MYYQSKYTSDEIEEDERKNFELASPWKDITSSLMLCKFTPSIKYRQLRLRKDHHFKSEIKSILHRKSVLVVTKTHDENWWYVKCGHNSGWTHIYDQMVSDGVIKQVNCIQRYETWHGNNTFCCNGRLIVGNDNITFSVTNLSILLISFLFFYDTHWTLKMNILLYTLLVFIFINLWCAYLTEPGILPRNAPGVQIPVPPDIDTIEYKYCETCNIYKPPRAKHCSICNNCILKFDHHCPWTGNCVGERNYRYFFNFLLSLTLYLDVIFILSITALIQSMISHPIDHSPNTTNHPKTHSSNTQQHTTFTPIELRENSILISITVFLFICGCALNPLTLYHIFLLTRGLTTNEDLKRIYPHNRHPHNQGCLSNMRQLYCTPISRTKLLPMHDVISDEHYFMLTEASQHSSV